MSAGDRDTLALVLANHTIRLSYRTQIVSCWGCDWDADYGLGVASDVLHRNHLADVIASSDWLREQRTEAWDDGYGTCLGDFDIAARREARSPNPYRTTENTDAH